MTKGQLITLVRAERHFVLAGRAEWTKYHSQMCREANLSLLGHAEREITTASFSLYLREIYIARLIELDNRVSVFRHVFVPNLSLDSIEHDFV